MAESRSTIKNKTRGSEVKDGVTLQPRLLQSKVDSFQNLHVVVMELMDKVALTDFIPGPTTGLTIR